MICFHISKVMDFDYFNDRLVTVSTEGEVSQLYATPEYKSIHAWDRSHITFLYTVLIIV